jgi:hypothetical protein
MTVNTETTYHTQNILQLLYIVYWGTNLYFKKAGQFQLYKEVYSLPYTV